MLRFHPAGGNASGNRASSMSLLKRRRAICSPGSRMSGSTLPSANLDPRRKRLLFRAWHRGMREMDLILGAFCNAEIASCSAADVEALEALFEVPDQDVYTWLTGTAAVPPDHDTADILATGGHFSLAQTPDGLDALALADIARALAARLRDRPAVLVHIARDGPRSAAMEAALGFFGSEIEVLSFPAWDCQPYDRVSPNAAVVARRMTTLARLATSRG
eukprot:gene53546-71567_t